jgi:hypothetical protein
MSGNNIKSDNFGGRKRDLVRTKYEVLNDDKVKCKFCEEEVSAKADRMKNHLEKCLKHTEDKPSSTGKIINNANNFFPAKKTKTDNPFSNGQLQTTLEKNVVRTSKDMKNTLDMACARFIFSCNISFLSADNRNFKNFMKIARPGYTPPDKKALSTLLLDKVYQEVKTEINNEIENLPDTSAITIMQDGWLSIEVSTTSCV